MEGTNEYDVKPTGRNVDALAGGTAQSLDSWRQMMWRGCAERFSFTSEHLFVSLRPRIFHDPISSCLRRFIDMGHRDGTYMEQHTADMYIHGGQNDHYVGRRKRAGRMHHTTCQNCCSPDPRRTRWDSWRTVGHQSRSREVANIHFGKLTPFSHGEQLIQAEEQRRRR
jgi:hypothetical protein